MAFNVIGLFDTARDAEGAARALRDAGFDDISFVGNNANKDYDTGGSEAAEGAGAGATGGAVLGGLAGLLVGLGALVIPGIGPVVAAGTLATALGSTAVGAGIGAATGGLVGGLVGAGVPEDDANVYAEGVRRGGSVLTVGVYSQDEAKRAASIMDGYNVVDIDRRGEEYRQSGWSRFDPNAAAYDASANTRNTTTATPVASTIDTTATASTSRSRDIDQSGEIRVPVVEEQLRVGKRAVEGGGVRVFQRVQETPINEQVTLRDETVRVDRNPVDRELSSGEVDAAFRDGDVIEVLEHDEEAIVDKQARVVEEVVIRKDAQERTENIQDSVRRTDVQVENVSGTTRTSDYREVGGTRTSDYRESTTAATQDEGMIERGASKAENAVERGTGLDLDRDGDVGQRDPRNNI